MKKYFIYIIPFFFLFLANCEKQDDFSNVSEEYQYNAEFALAIGKSHLNLEDMGENLPDGWMESPQLLQYLDNLQLKVEFPFDVSKFSSDSSYIKQIVFNFRIQNEFPEKGYLRIYFANTSRIITDTIPEIVPINAATAQGDSTISYPSVTSITLNKEFVYKLQQTRYIIIEGVMENLMKDNYANYSKYNLNIEMGTRISFDFNLNKLTQ